MPNYRESFPEELPTQDRSYCKIMPIWTSPWGRIFPSHQNCPIELHIVSHSMDWMTLIIHTISHFTKRCCTVLQLQWRHFHFQWVHLCFPRVIKKLCNFIILESQLSLWVLHYLCSVSLQGQLFMVP